MEYQNDPLVVAMRLWDKVPQNTHTVDMLSSKTDGMGEILVYKVESHSVQSNRASLDITGSSMRTRSRDDAQQIYLCGSGERFFFSVPDGVLNLLSSFTSLEASLRA